MSPILVRPVREQLEHDRVIRLLQARWRRKYLVSINQGAETVAPVSFGDSVLYPDLVFASAERAHRPEIVVEVETAESVNNLEAMAEWVRFGQLKAAFHLYVPTGSLDSAKRLCQDHRIPVEEIWTYHLVGDQMRFAPVYKAPPRPARRPAAEPAKAVKPVAKPVGKPVASPAVKPVKPAAKPAKAAAKVAKPTKAAAPKPAPKKVVKPAPGKGVAPKKAGAKKK